MEALAIVCVFVVGSHSSIAQLSFSSTFSDSWRSLLVLPLGIHGAREPRPFKVCKCVPVCGGRGMVQVFGQFSKHTDKAVLMMLNKAHGQLVAIVCCIGFDRFEIFSIKSSLKVLHQLHSVSYEMRLWKNGSV